MGIATNRMCECGQPGYVSIPKPRSVEVLCTRCVALVWAALEEVRRDEYLREESGDLVRKRGDLQPRPTP